MNTCIYIAPVKQKSSEALAGSVYVPLVRFYRAMHFSAKRGIAIACRLSVRPSVCDVGEL